MKQNKGQVLALFVIFLPLFLLIFVAIIDIGRLHIEKRKLDATIYMACQYALLHKDEENILDKVKQLIYQNQPDIEKLNIQMQDDVVILATKNYKPLFPLKYSNYTIRIQYHGTQVGEKYKIKKE